MSRVEFKSFKGVQIMMVDLSNLKQNEVPSVMDDMWQLIEKQAEHSVLTLTDMTNMGFTSDIVTGLKNLVAHNKPYVKASAVIGNDGLLKIIVGSIEKATSRTFAKFDTREEAMEWLAQR